MFDVETKPKEETMLLYKIHNLSKKNYFKI